MEETVCSIHRESNPVHPATECSVTAVALYMWVGDLLGYTTFVEEAVRHLTSFNILLAVHMISAVGPFCNDSILDLPSHDFSHANLLD